MIYRLLQFKNALFPNITDTELEWVMSYLSYPGYKLFVAQSPAEQRHAIDVAKSLVKYADELSVADFTMLIQASLLHDCGKQKVNITLWHRIIIVILNKFSYQSQKVLKFCTIVTQSQEIAMLHPKWGKELAQKVGLPEDVCLLIERHHEPPCNRLNSLLYYADNQN